MTNTISEELQLVRLLAQPPYAAEEKETLLRMLALVADPAERRAACAVLVQHPRLIPRLLDWQRRKTQALANRNERAWQAVVEEEAKLLEELPEKNTE